MHTEICLLLLVVGPQLIIPESLHFLQTRSHAATQPDCKIRVRPNVCLQRLKLDHFGTKSLFDALQDCTNDSVFAFVPKMVWEVRHLFKMFSDPQAIANVSNFNMVIRAGFSRFFCAFLFVHLFIFICLFPSIHPFLSFIHDFICVCNFPIACPCLRLCLLSRGNLTASCTSRQ